MLNVSDAYLELMNSNIRPQLEPVITLTGSDVDGNAISMEWTKSDIQELTYKREIDPAGRSLPYMELSWTERVSDPAQINEQKYNNVGEYMAIDLTFKQKLNFYSTWKTLFNSGMTWASLFNQKITWKQLKELATVESIKMPRMFLSAKPIFNKNTIRWTAKDFLGFLADDTVTNFMAGIPFVNPIKYMLMNSITPFIDNVEMRNVILATVNNLTAFQDSAGLTLGHHIVFDNSLQNNLLNYSNIKSLFWNFLPDGSAMPYSSFDGSATNVFFGRKVLYDYPEIVKNSNIAQYSYTLTNYEENESRNYTKSSSFNTSYGNSVLYTWNFDGYGTIKDSYNSTLKDSSVYDINKAVGWVDGDMVITPIEVNKVNEVAMINRVGETYTEDNPINGLKSDALTRLLYLDLYFRKENWSYSFEALPNLAIEPGDLVTVAINRNTDSGAKEGKRVLVINTEFTYNGAIREKLKAHGV